MKWGVVQGALERRGQQEALEGGLGSGAEGPTEGSGAEGPMGLGTSGADRIGGANGPRATFPTLLGKVSSNFKVQGHDMKDLLGAAN